MIYLDETFKFKCGTSKCGTRQLIRSLKKASTVESCGCRDYKIISCPSNFMFFEYKCDKCIRSLQMEKRKSIYINGEATTFLQEGCELFHKTFKPLNYKS